MGPPGEGVASPQAAPQNAFSRCGPECRPSPTEAEGAAQRGWLLRSVGVLILR